MFWMQFCKYAFDILHSPSINYMSTVLKYIKNDLARNNWKSVSTFCTGAIHNFKTMWFQNHENSTIFLNFRYDVIGKLPAGIVVLRCSTKCFD